MKIYKDPSKLDTYKDPSDLEKGKIFYLSYGEQERLYPIVYLGKKEILYKFYDVQNGVIKGFYLDTWLNRGVRYDMYDMVVIHTYGAI